MELIIESFLGGMALFFVVLAWQYHRRFSQARFQLEFHRQAHLQTLDSLNAQLRFREERLEELQRKWEEEMRLRTSLAERASRLGLLENQLINLQEELSFAKAKEAELTAHLQQERGQMAEKVALFQEAQKNLQETFKVLSAEALRENNQFFLNQAQVAFQQHQERSQEDLTQRQQSIKEMLTPMQAALTKVDGKIEELEKARVGAYHTLKQQVHEMMSVQNSLRLETSNLVKALRSPSIRGQWGEMQLRRVVEVSGMLSHCDFTEQVSVQQQEVRLRPDMIIHLPGGKKIIVDAKAPLAAYLESLEADSEERRVQFLTDHARQVRAHIRALSGRSYWSQFSETPEFVVLFLPSETFFSAALEKDPSLLEFGVQEKVILASPTTLIALLRAVAFGWRGEAIAENAKAISHLGRELYKRIGDVSSHMARLGRALGSANEAYNQSIGTLERRVLVTARKFQELEVAAETTPLPELDQVLQVPRIPLGIEADAEEDIAAATAVLPQIAKSRKKG